jgi:hypothetical protein
VELELRFDALGDALTGAVVDLHVEDLAVADAVSGAGTVSLGPYTVSPERPTVRLTVDLPVPTGTRQAGLLVRVRARTADDAPVTFWNASATLLPLDAAGPLRVPLERGA